MEIFFRSKEESNLIQEEEFLKLAPQDRFYSFLALMDKLKIFINTAGDNKGEELLNNNYQSEFYSSKTSSSLTNLKNNSFKIMINA